MNTNLLPISVVKPSPMSSISLNKTPIKKPHKKSSNPGLLALKLNALKILFVELETKIDDINSRLQEREINDQIITNATNGISGPLRDIGAKKGSINLEFQGMKQLVGKQQMSIMK